MDSPQVPKKAYWFPINPDGPGWSWPCAWQGWALLAFVVAASTVIAFFVPGLFYRYGSIAVLWLIVHLTLTFKGEPRK
jgi:hypothetical protein